MSAETPRAYPLRRPGREHDDSRFTIGLLHDVVQVLEQHGYPPVRHGLDIVDLQQHLFAFLYGEGGVR